MRALLLLPFVSGAAASGCAHTVVIETEPVGAEVRIDGQSMGEGPVVTQQRTSTGSRMHVEVSAEGFEPESVIVMQSDWFLWPALIAAIPAFGVPFVVVPFAGPFITLGWAVATSPSLIALAFLQKYPDRVQIKLRPRLRGDVLQPTDTWLVPDDVSPNPPPLGGEDPPPPEPEPRRPQPPGANPVPD